MHRPALLLLAGLLAACPPVENEGDYDLDGVADENDCAPGDPDVHPGDADPPDDGVDTDCDGSDGVDRDADGFAANREEDDPLRDCNDADAAINPDATEVNANGIDENCDGSDEGDFDGDDTRDSEDCAPADPTLNAEDHDGDGATSCAGDCDDQDARLYPDDADGDGVSPCDGDCDDVRATVYPGAVELCDLEDGDCSGDLPATELDGDADGFAPCQGDCDDGDPALTPTDLDSDGSSTCGGDCDDEDPALQPDDEDRDGASTCDGDCDDFDPNRHPTAQESCNGLDDDCDGALPADEGDADGDFTLACADCDDGDPEHAVQDLDGDGYDECSGDCSEGNPAIYPGAGDPFGDGIDQDCAGADGVDADGDGWPGNAPSSSSTWDCDDADPQVGRDDSDGDGVDDCEGDCDDGDASRFPGNAEDSCDLLDTDCFADPSEVDGDGDGAAPCQGDCDDGDAGLSIADADADGFTSCGDDCDDSDPDVAPGSPLETADGVDSNCDGDDSVVLATSYPALFGPHLGAQAGRAVVPLGDQDGDGLHDFAIGTARDGPTPGSTGSLSLVYGAALPEVAAGIDAVRAGSIVGPSGSGFGYDAVSLGDVDGDGVAELAVAAGEEEAVYVFAGDTVWAPGVRTLNIAAVRVEVPGYFTTDYELVGGRRLVAGDFDADGLPDLMVGRPRADHGGGIGLLDLISGDQLAAAISTWRQGGQGSTEAIGPALSLQAGPTAALGAALAAVPDIDGDGAPELAISDPLWNGARGTYYVLWSAGIAAATFTSASEEGVYLDQMLGWSLLGLEDLDGDGLGELFVGARREANGGGVGAEASLLTGAELSGGSPSVAAAAANIELGYSNTTRVASLALSHLGDLDGDGLGEIGFGAIQEDPGGSPWRKELFVFTGGDLAAGGTLAHGDARTWYVDSRSWGVDVPRAVGVGDVDGDGLDDIAVMNFERTVGRIWFVKGAW